MQTIINSDSRVFLISREGFSTRDYFCNIKDIPKIIREELEPNDSYKILEYWNKKFTRVSKKRINEMFEANQIDFKIK